MVNFCRASRKGAPSKALEKYRTFSRCYQRFSSSMGDATAACYTVIHDFLGGSGCPFLPVIFGTPHPSYSTVWANNRLSAFSRFRKL
jgi:hypothetical protein